MVKVYIISFWYQHREGITLTGVAECKLEKEEERRFESTEGFPKDIPPQRPNFRVSTHQQRDLNIVHHSDYSLHKYLDYIQTKVTTTEITS
jgi:hypothetical protein